MTAKTPARPDLRILISNDDGVRADGIEVLREIAAAISDDVWVCAPEYEQSGASHSLTLHDPLRVRQYEERVFSITGTPTDAVGYGVKRLLKDRKPDLELSGVNHGSNIADDVTYSGTVAGAMEGTVLKIRSIAFSQAYGFSQTERFLWETARAYGPSVILALLDQDWPEGVLWNVNFPDLPPDAVERFEITRQGARDVNNLFIEERHDARGHPYYWLGFNRALSNPPEGTDLRAIYEGRISATPLHLDLTYRELVERVGSRLTGAPPKMP